MAPLSQLIDPKVFAQLNQHQMDQLIAVVDAEILVNPEIRKLLQKRIEAYVPHLKTRGE